MFQPAPRRHRRLPSGTMVSYAEVKSYLSKREIPQLFESLMAGLMYHRPENHIGYLQSCLDEVKTNSETKVQWSTFVNAKKRKSKEILPPLTPKKQDSYSSSWSDNSRQSTPLPPISARTRTRMSMEQQDLRNTYILYHNPPPVLAKPKVPVVSVLGGLGTKIDELCERVVGRLRGVVHISTCSMLKTRMTIEGFYRVTSVPACAVVDSVLQAMSMVQSANALIVAGFPRNRGDIEEYRSRRVRMDGVVLVDFEEEALRNFLEHEVATGVVRTSEIEAELERYKQDIISVAEYYDDKQLLTVVMGDQDLEEIIDDLVLAVDKVIETRKNLAYEESLDIQKDRECDSPCKALIPSPDRMERPSTVEIRDATEEDIKSIEAETMKTSEDDDISENKDSIENASSEAAKSETIGETEIQFTEEIEKSESGDIHITEMKQPTKPEEEEAKDKQTENSKIENSLGSTEEKSISENSEEKININGIEDKQIKNSEDVPGDTDDSSQIKETLEIKDSNNTHIDSEQTENSELNRENKEASIPDKEALDTEAKEEISSNIPSVPLIFSFENVNADYDELRNLIANDLEMCFIDFHELMRNDGSNNDKFDNDEALSLLRGILKQDSVSYSNGFFIATFPFFLLSAVVVEELQKLGDLSFVCKIRENKSGSESESKEQPEERLYSFTLSEKVKIIFVTEDNIINELRRALQEIIDNKNTKDQKISHKTLEHEMKETTMAENVIEQSSNADDKMAATNVECTVQETDISLEDKVEECKENADEADNENANGGGKEDVGDTDKENVSKDKKDIEGDLQANEEITTDEKTNDYEDSTGKDVDDLVSDDTLNEGSKPPDSLKTEEDQETITDDVDVDDAHSQASTLPSAGEETQKERAVLERQPGVELEIGNNSEEKTNKAKLIRSSTYSASEKITDVEEDKEKSSGKGSDSTKESENNEATAENEDKVSEIENANESNGSEVFEHKENGEGSENKEDVVGVCEEDNTENALNENDVVETVESQPRDTNDLLPDEEEKSGKHLSDSEIKRNEDTSDTEDKKEENPLKNEEKNSEHLSETEENNSEDQQSLSEESKVDNKETEDGENSKDENAEKVDEANKESVKNESLDNLEDEARHADTEEPSEQHDDSSEANGVKDESKSENVTPVENGEPDSVKDVSSNAEHTENGVSKEESGLKVGNENNEYDPCVDKLPEKETSEVPLEKDPNENEENTEKEKSEECEKDSEKPDQHDKEKSEKSEQLENEINEKSEQLENEINEKSEQLENETTEKSSQLEDETNEKSEQLENETSEKSDQLENETNEKSEQLENEISEKSDQLENETNEKSEQLENEPSEKSDQLENETNEKSEQLVNETSEKSEQHENEANENLDQLENKTSEKSEQHEIEKSDDLETETVEEKEGSETNQENDENKTENTEENESQKENEQVKSQKGEGNVEETPDNKQENSESTNDDPKLEDKNSLNNEQQIAVTENSKKHRQRLDNDSDSNDENITIETQAEIHAIDCESPPTTEDPEREKTKPDNEENEGTENMETNTDKKEAENSIGDDSVGKQSEVVEDNLEKETVLENIDESDNLTLDSIRNDRYSGKIQERNGSGILDESRAEDQQESEEPQERSSSSSRGEL